MFESTRLRLEELRKLLETEIAKSPGKVISLSKAQEIFAEVFKTSIGSRGGVTRSLAGDYSRFKSAYPSYFKGLNIVKSDQELFRNYLLKRAQANTTPVETTVKDLLKDSKINFSDDFIKSKDIRTLAGNVIRGNPELKAKFLLTGIGGVPHEPGGTASKIPTIYKTSKKFKSFYDSTYDTPWKDAKYDAKFRAITSFENRPPVLSAGYTLTTKELAKKLGMSEGTISGYFSKANKKNYTLSTARFIRENFKFEKYRTPGKIGETRYWKEPSDLLMRQWNSLQNSRRISSDMIKNIKTLYNDPKIYKTIFTDKKLPLLEDVQAALDNKSPAKAANSMATLARVLKGDDFRTTIDIDQDVAAGKRIIEQIGKVGKNDAYRAAFYRVALDNVGKIYKDAGPTTLKEFQGLFREELRTVLGLKPKEVIPFSINEVIGVTTGEMRGLQPYTAFVDITAKNINENALAAYQGQLSHRIGQIQTVMKGGTYEKVNYANVSEAGRVAKAEELARKLMDTKKLAQATLMDPKGDYRLTRQQVGQLGMADIKVGTKIDPEIYSPELLKKWKKQSKGALDIEKMTQREGFYVDVKGRTPHFDVSKTELFARVRDIFTKGKPVDQYKVAYQLKCVGAASGGRVGFALGTGAINCVENKLKNQPLESTKALSALEEGATGVLGKVRNAAKGFLGLMGKFGPAAGKYGAIAAVGALAQPLVKEFFNDDPSTYLTDPEQIEGMLLSTIEAHEQREKLRSPILDTATTVGALGATAAAVPGTGALWKARRLPTLKREAMGMPRAALGPAMKLISGMYTPAGLLAHEPLRIAQMRGEGESWGEIAKSPTLWMGPAFADTMTRMATRGMRPGSTLSKALSLGMSRPMLKNISRKFGMPGLALSLGLSGYDKYQDWKNKEGWFAKKKRQLNLDED